MEPGFSSVLASAKTSIALCKYPGILRQSDSPDDQQGVQEVTIPSHAIQAAILCPHSQMFTDFLISSIVSLFFDMT